MTFVNTELLNCSAPGIRRWRFRKALDDGLVRPRDFDTSAQLLDCLLVCLFDESFHLRLLAIESGVLSKLSEAFSHSRYFMVFRFLLPHKLCLAISECNDLG